MAAGFIVKTRADADTREARASNPARRDAAFASGAQIVTTDFLMPDKKIGPYQVNWLADGQKVQCDAKLPGLQCFSWNERPRADRGGGGGALNSSGSSARALDSPRQRAPGLDIPMIVRQWRW